MKDINQDQESLNVLEIRKLLKKTCIETDRRNKSSYVINKKEIEMTIRIIRKKDVLIN